MTCPHLSEKQTFDAVPIANVYTLEADTVTGKAVILRGRGKFHSNTMGMVNIMR